MITIKKLLLICILSVVLSNVSTSNISATNDIQSDNNFQKESDELEKKYEKYMEYFKNINTEEELDAVTEEFYKDIGAKVNSKKVEILRENKHKKYETINSYNVVGEENESDIQTKNMNTFAVFKTGDFKIQTLKSGIASNFKEEIKKNKFLGLAGSGINIVAGKYVPPIGIATDLMGALANPSHSYYNTANIVSISNDKTLHNKIVQIYTSQGKWEPYIQSARLVTDALPIHRYHKNGTWYVNKSAYYRNMKVESGTHFSDDNYLINMAKSKWKSGGSKYGEAYYTGKVTYNQAALNRFVSWANKY